MELEPTDPVATARDRSLRLLCVLGLVVASFVIAEDRGYASPADLALACPVAAGSGFTDVGPSGTHAAAIGCLVAWSITAGIDAQRFAPDRAVTRAQMATFLARLLRSAGEPVLLIGEGPIEFADVLPQAHVWNIVALYRNGLVEGRRVSPFGPVFDPHEPVTRAQMATFLRRVVEYLGVALPDAASPFTDVSGVHAPAVGALAASGVVQGRTATRYDPHASVTRAQMATFLMRTADLLLDRGVGELPPSMTGPLPDAPPTSVAGTALAGGAEHTCARLADGGVACWGSNEWGQLGDGTRQSRLTPVRVTGLHDVVEVTAGGAFTCARHADGTVSCWGWGQAGQLGDGTMAIGWHRTMPRRVIGLTDTVGIAAGQNHTCAVHRDGGLSCWGANYQGQLGDIVVGPAVDRAVPMRAQFVREAVQTAAGGTFSCVRHRAGTVSCWGSYGAELGRGLPPDDLSADEWLLWNERSLREDIVPKPVVDLEDAVELDVGTSHACVRRVDATVWCWGSNHRGLIGDGTTELSRFSPTRTGDIDDAVEITAGHTNSCARHADGRVSCWGDGQYGQNGDGTLFILRREPTLVDGLDDATSVVAGYWQVCATRPAATPVCWGWNHTGTVGDGTTTMRRAPVQVSALPG